MAQAGKKGSDANRSSQPRPTNSGEQAGKKPRVASQAPSAGTPTREDRNIAASRKGQRQPAPTPVRGTPPTVKATKQKPQASSTSTPTTSTASSYMAMLDQMRSQASAAQSAIPPLPPLQR